MSQPIAALPGSAQPRFVPARDPPPPGAGEVLCRTLQLGVCGTDREILHSQRPFCPPGEEYLVLGHECLAVVEQIGDSVSDVRAGDLVVPVVRRPLPGARHRVDLLEFGQYTERGIFFEHGFSSPRWLDRPEYLYRVDPRLAEVAVLAEPLAVSEKAVNEALTIQQARLGADAWTDSPPRVLVTGMGPIGFTAVLASICRGWPVTMCGRDEPDSFRVRLAQRFGARYVRDPMTLNVENVDRDGYDLILECTGSDDVMLAAAGALASRGVMVWLGSSRVPQPRTHNVARLMRDAVIRNHVHLGTVNAAPRDFADALAHLAELHERCGEPLAALITNRVRGDDALWHYEHREPQGIKTVVMYD
ncbi:MAG: alcohol dehydrogenase catalytic domain-containing protein [Pirellulales bacterium]